MHAFPIGQSPWSSIIVPVSLQKSSLIIRYGDTAKPTYASKSRPHTAIIKLNFALYRCIYDIGVVLRRTRITGQGAVSPAGIENRRIASIFQGAMRAVSLIGCHLRQALIAA